MPTLTAPWAPRLLGCHVVVVDGDRVVAVEADSLQPVWEQRCQQADWASILPGSHADLDVVTCGAMLRAVDGRSGEIRWSQPVPYPMDRVRVGSSVVVLQSDDVGVTVIDLASGRTRFQIDAPVPANIAADEDLVYVARDDGVTAYDSEDGEPQWSSLNDTTAVFAGGGEVFVRTRGHVIHRLDRATGESTVDSGAPCDDLNFTDFRFSDDDVLLLQAVEDSLDIAVYNRDTLERRWSEPLDSAAVVGGGDGLVGIQPGFGQDLVVHDAVTGVEVARFRNTAPAPPVIRHRRLYFIGLDRDGFAQLRVERLD